MRAVGFSTGALALSDFRHALDLLKGKGTKAVELSALRQRELIPLFEAAPALDLHEFQHVSVHAPSSISAEFEETAAGILHKLSERGWLIIVHPDVIHTPSLWIRLGNRLCIENMDKRKPVGQTAKQLQRFFMDLPRASFCMDLGHARQVDPTMAEAFLMLRQFRSRLRQLHVSDVNSDSRHGELTAEAYLAFKRVADLIPDDLPVILESRVPNPDIDREVELVRRVLSSRADHQATRTLAFA